MAILETAATRREELVRKHVEAENAADYETALATFQHPRYEYVATDEVYDGAEEVLAHWREFDRAFPDQQIEIVELHKADDAVLMEAIARGTHTGPFRGLPPDGPPLEAAVPRDLRLRGRRAWSASASTTTRPPSCSSWASPASPPASPAASRRPPAIR